MTCSEGAAIDLEYEDLSKEWKCADSKETGSIIVSGLHAQGCCGSGPSACEAAQIDYTVICQNPTDWLPGRSFKHGGEKVTCFGMAVYMLWNEDLSELCSSAYITTTFNELQSHGCCGSAPSACKDDALNGDEDTDDTDYSVLCENSDDWTPGNPFTFHGETTTCSEAAAKHLVGVDLSELCSSPYFTTTSNVVHTQGCCGNGPSACKKNHDDPNSDDGSDDPTADTTVPTGPGGDSISDWYEYENDYSVICQNPGDWQPSKCIKGGGEIMTCYDSAVNSNLLFEDLSGEWKCSESSSNTRRIINRLRAKNCCGISGSSPCLSNDVGEGGGDESTGLDGGRGPNDGSGTDSDHKPIPDGGPGPDDETTVPGGGNGGGRRLDESDQPASDPNVLAPTMPYFEKTACQIAIDTCMTDNDCKEMGEMIYNSKKDWEIARWPVGVQCAQNGFPLMRYMMSQLSGKVSFANTPKAQKFFKDASKWHEAPFNQTDSSQWRLCEVYDFCMSPFASNNMTYIMRVSNGEKILNKNFRRLEKMHCANPFSNEETKIAARRSSSFNKVSEIDISTKMNEPTRLVEQYYDCESILYQNPATVLGSTISLATFIVTIIVTIAVFIIVNFHYFVRRDKSVDSEWTDKEVAVVLKVIAEKELSRLGGLTGRKTDGSR
eukprot:CAMPEP_0182459586 /NCGR_PEP_ID=MMETSP1319-20130603/4679_1 /TAXON_ID=172717 /ORGANISM="Bolidomonas pacifica, Strain RCC208" /LENGTH=662 /DNA_ID=CAMNT_0024658535 /DNA_START=78 /DNA_END=2063 /DNA_ORIENTATION=-